MRLYHWTAKKKKGYINKVGLKTRFCIFSPTYKGIYASTDSDRWKHAIAYDYESDVVCFSFDSKKLRTKHLFNDTFIVMDNIPASKLQFEGLHKRKALSELRKEL